MRGKLRVLGRMMHMRESITRGGNTLILSGCLLAAERQLRAAQATCATSRDETHFPAGARVATDARALADVLVVATAERVIHRLQVQCRGIM